MRKGLLQQLGHIFLYIDSIVDSLNCSGVEERCRYLIVLHQTEHGGQYGGIHRVAWRTREALNRAGRPKKHVLPACDVSVRTENTCCIRSRRYVWKNWVPDGCAENFCNSTSRISCPERGRAYSATCVGGCVLKTNLSPQHFSWYA